MFQFAITSITRTTTVDAGVFAPGHLGELTQFTPFELVDAVLDETGRGERRLRLLPSRVGVYYVLALTLFPDLSCQAVWRQLTASIGPLAPKVSVTALRHLCRRLTPVSFETLFDILAVPLAPPTTPGVSYRGLRTVAFDGPFSGQAGEVELIVGKHRNGPTATITVANQLHYSRFIDMALT